MLTELKTSNNFSAIMDIMLDFKICGVKYFGNWSPNLSECQGSWADVFIWSKQV